jgi:hypothetical protein
MDLYIENDDLIPVGGWINKRLQPASLLVERKAIWQDPFISFDKINRL